MRDGARLKADVMRPDAPGRFPAILNLGSVPEGQAVDSSRHPGGEAEPADELGNRQPGMVGAEWLRCRAGRRARQREVSRPMRAVVARGGDRLLRRDRMGGGATLVLGQGRTLRHILFRHQPVVRRQSAAAVIESHHTLGGFCRSLPRRPVPWRALEPVHAELVRGAHDASSRRPRFPTSSQRLANQYAAFLAA